ncbi:hypothetical protein BAE44_0018937 [Dichanthelium oligosanthes]|uniref:V-type proton ATPase subunit S1/VOA1 transmembrane domain-containing protein n=1 Tax=Dichanthelium oligosanthes TaxID=888268 RepID=A0A1E5V4X9_9POAL|nr:hypothetical protein BAE44_0018937 [Dichanthelium oligosanthes]
MAAAGAVLAVLLLAAQVASAAPAVAPAFLWAPKNYGFCSNDAKEVVHYQTVSPKILAKSVLEEGGWSNLMLQSSDISKDKQVDPALADTLKLSFTSSEFSMAFPYVSTTDDEKMEDSLLSGFDENCNSGFERNRITYTDTCTVTSEDLKKHNSMDSIRDFVTSRMGNSPRDLLSELVAMLKKSGAKYTILYASQPSGLLVSPSNLPLGRYLAEKTNNTTKTGLGKCDGECLVKSTLLEGTFVGIVLLIILISGLMCMMGIDTPSRFEAPQES